MFYDQLNIGGEMVSLYSMGFWHCLKSALEGAIFRVWMSVYVLNMNPKRKSDPLLKIIACLSNLQKHRNGSVKMVLHMPRKGASNRHCNLVFGRFLIDQGFDVRQQSGNSSLHAKTILIDNTHLFVGSHNMVKSSIFNPLEVTAYISDPTIISVFADDYTKWFETLETFGSK